MKQKKLKTLKHRLQRSDSIIHADPYSHAEKLKSYKNKGQPFSHNSLSSATSQISREICLSGIYFQKHAMHD